MLNRFAWMLALISLSTFAAASSTPLNNFDELLNALDSGKPVRAMAHFSKCEKSSGGDLGSISAGFNFEVYNHYQYPTDTGNMQELIATSKTIFSITDYLKLGQVINYVRLHIFKNNTAELYGVLLDPVTYEKKMTVTYNCQIGNDKGLSLVSLDN